MKGPLLKPIITIKRNFLTGCHNLLTDTFFGMVTQYSFLSFFWQHNVASKILVPQSVIGPLPPTADAWSLNRWAPREVLVWLFSLLQICLMMLSLCLVAFNLCSAFKSAEELLEILMSSPYPQPIKSEPLGWTEPLAFLKDLQVILTYSWGWEKPT